LTTPLKRPPGRPPSFTPGKPTQTQNSQYIKEAAIAHRDRGSSLRHQRLGASSARMPGNTTQDGSAAGVVPAEEIKDRGGAQGCWAPKKGQAKQTTTQQLEIPQPEPAPTPGPTRQPTLTISTQNTKDPTDVPWPRPPPKPNVVDQASPSMSSRAVNALAALTATRKNNDFGSRQIAVARSDAQQGKTTSLMQPQPLLAVHPFTPTLNKW
jgi:hypothetical protein